MLWDIPILLSSTTIWIYFGHQQTCLTKLTCNYLVNLFKSIGTNWLTHISLLYFIQKPVIWFAKQIKWLVSIWNKTLCCYGLQKLFSKNQRLRNDQFTWKSWTFLNGISRKDSKVLIFIFSSNWRKQSYMLLRTCFVNCDAILPVDHKLSSLPSLLCNHNAVSISIMAVIVCFIKLTKKKYERLTL